MRASYTLFHVSLQIFRDTQATNFTNSGWEHVVHTCSYPLQYNLLIHVQTHTYTHTHTHTRARAPSTVLWFKFCMYRQNAKLQSKLNSSANASSDIFYNSQTWCNAGIRSLSLGSLQILCIMGMWLWWCVFWHSRLFKCVKFVVFHVQRFRHNSKHMYSARNVDNVCGPQKGSLKQIMCFIRKQIRDTDHYVWKVFPTSFQVQTFAWSSCVLRNVNLFRFPLPSDCILFAALQTTLFFCFLSYIRFRDILFYFPSGCQFVGEIILWWEGNAVVLLVSGCCVQYI